MGPPAAIKHSSSTITRRFRGPTVAQGGHEATTHAKTVRKQSCLLVASPLAHVTTYPTSSNCRAVAVTAAAATAAKSSRRTCTARSKGSAGKVPKPGRRRSGLHRPRRGNTSELGDADFGPRKSYLFFLRHGRPGIGLSRERDVVAVKRPGCRDVWCSRERPLKIRASMRISLPRPYPNRNRSPR